MSTQPVIYWVDMGGQSFHVRTIRGTETMSKPFKLDIAFQDRDRRGLDSKELVKSAASVRLIRENTERKIDGVITHIKVEASILEAPEVQLSIEPRLALLRWREDCRIFRTKTVVQIVTEVLDGLNVKHEWRLGGSYDIRQYTVQWNESDFDFVMRMLEDEGIFYYFLTGDVMVLGDGPSAYEPLPEGRMPFRAMGQGLDQNEDAIYRFGHRAALRPQKVSLRDFNHETPSLDMEVAAPTPSPSGVEWYDYPGEYETPADGNRKAKLHSEAFACQASMHRGSSFAARMMPGGTWTLVDAPSGVEDREYVLTEVTHKWERDEEGYSNHFRALDSDVTFRPPRETYVPTILNPHTGVITGPEGVDDIYTDKWGRVKVHFIWDRLQPYDDDCSYWVPVLQDNTGHSSAIPRRNWEVLVHYMEGDPDRPVVMGRTYNGGDVFPQHPVKDKTMSQLHSLSTPSRNGSNTIRFEDKAGAEHIWMHAQKDMNVRVANNKTETVLVDESRNIDNDELKQIGNDHNQRVSGTTEMVVGQNQTWSVGGNRERKVTGDSAPTVEGNRVLTIGGNHTRKFGNASNETQHNLTENIGAIDLEASLKSNTMQGEMGAALTVGGAIVELAKDDKNETAAKARAETIGGIYYSKSGEEWGTTAQKVRNTTVGGFLKVTSLKEMTLVGVETLTTNSATFGASGGTALTIKVGATSLVFQDGSIAVNAPSGIKLTVSGKNKQGAKTSTQI